MEKFRSNVSNTKGFEVLYSRKFDTQQIGYNRVLVLPSEELKTSCINLDTWNNAILAQQMLLDYILRIPIKYITILVHFKFGTQVEKLNEFLNSK